MLFRGAWTMNKNPHVVKAEVLKTNNPTPATVMIACEELVIIARRGGWSLENILDEIKNNWKEQEAEGHE